MYLIFFLLVLLVAPCHAVAGMDCIASGKPGDLCEVDLHWIHPTQGAVGELEVRAKRAAYREEIEAALEKGNPESHYDDFLLGKKRKLEMVFGPPKGNSSKPTLYIIDRHHTSRALFLEFDNLSLAKKKELGGFPKAYAHLAADLSHLSRERFEEVMERPYEYFSRHPKYFSPEVEIHKRSSWVRLKDAQGEKINSWSLLPKDLSSMPDDPFRSVAWMLRESDAFKKSMEPFVEFHLADRLRKDFPKGDIMRLISQSPDEAAKVLGGWASQNLDTMGLEVAQEFSQKDLVESCQVNFQKLVKKAKNIP